MTSDAQRRAKINYDKANMRYQTVKVSKALLTAFKAACAANGDKVNTVLRLAMEDYVKRSEQHTDVMPGGQDNSAL